MISIFAKPAFLNINPHEPFSERKKPVPKNSGYLMRVSSIIRGEQIAKQIGAKLNPKKGYENDVCIYVKPHVKEGMDFKFEGKPYLDIVDGHDLGQLAKKHPKLKVIVCSRADEKTMKKAINNEIIFIPQHHCNFERIKRTRKKVTTMGVIGTRDAFPLLPKQLKPELKKRGIKLLEFSRFFYRKDIIDFYKKIDIQFVWRPYRKTLSNPLKLVNAASFGIPTIALDEPAFLELNYHYIPVNNFETFLNRLDVLLNNPSVYEILSERCLEKAEEYHIEKVGEMYKALK